MSLLEGKVALVTGGTRGIGKAIALGYARQGAKVIIWGTNEEKAKETVNELKEASISNESHDYMLVDVSSKAKTTQALDEFYKEHEKLDILVNCAGITRDKLLLKMTEEDWDAVLDVNLKSVFNICSYAIKPMMKSRAGKIINITSVIGLTGNAGQVNYSSSKFGMVGFTRSLAIELAKRNVCVNAIAPGFIRSDMTDKLSEAQKESILNKVPMNKLGNPEDIANAAIFLASDMSNYITGQVLTVDGGMLA